jgi:hypothetical protein
MTNTTNARILEKPAFMRNMIVLAVLLCVTGLAAFDKIGEQTVSVIFGAVIAGVLTRAGAAAATRGKSDE